MIVQFPLPFRSAFHVRSDIDLNKAFDIPSYVLKYTMNGQDWPDGTTEYHAEVRVPTLIIHGAKDKLVTEEEAREMKEVLYVLILKCYIGTNAR